MGTIVRLLAKVLAVVIDGVVPSQTFTPFQKRNFKKASKKQSHSPLCFIQKSAFLMSPLSQLKALRMLALLGGLLLSNCLLATTYYSQGSLAANLPASWNTNRLGGGSTPANFTTDGDIFVVQGNGNSGNSPHSMMTTADWAITGKQSKLQIENGATLTATNLITFNTSGVNKGTFQVDNGGNYIHNVTGSTASGSANDFPGNSGIISLGATSNVTIQKWANGGTPTALASTAYGNLTIDVSSLSGSWNQTSNITNIQGALTIKNTGGAFEFRLMSTGTTTISIGSLNIQGGILSLISGNGTLTANVLGNVSVSGGNLDLNSNNAAASSTLNIAGDLLVSGTGILKKSQGTNNGTVNFNKSIGSQSIAITPSGINTSNIAFNVGDGTTANTLLLNSNFPINSAASLTVKDKATIDFGNSSVITGGTFSATAGATLKTGSIAGLTSSGATGCVQTTNRVFSTSANFTYNGTAGAQTTGNGLPATVNSLTINNASGVTLLSAKTVTSNLSIFSGAYLNLGTFAHSANSLTLGTNGVSSGSWGSTSSPAVNKNNTYFDANATGIVSVSTSTCIQPTITLGAIPSICTDATSFNLPYTATTGSPDQYSISGTGITTVTNGNLPASPITVSLSNPASTGNLPFTLTVRNSATGCISSTTSSAVTVNPTPTLNNASQAAPVCAGSTATVNLTGLVANSTVTVSYSINGTAQTSVSVTADASGNGSFTTLALTLANNSQTLQITGITITSATPNCSASFAKNVTLSVNANANAGTVSGTSPICVGQTVTYTSNGDAGGAWSSGNTFIATVNAGSGAVTGVGAGTTAIIYTLNSGCGAPVSATKNVTVQAVASAPTVNEPINAGATSVSGTNSNIDPTQIEVYVNGTLIGTASGPNNWTLSGIPALTAGSSITAKAVISGKCTSAASAPVIVSAVSAVPTVNAPLCEGSTEVSGTSSEVTGTVINVFVNNVSVGTTTVNGSGWSKTVSALVAGAGVKATATASGANESNPSSVVVVQTNGTLALTSGAGTNAQTVCVNSPIAKIFYSLGGSATGYTITGLPAGVNHSFSGGTITIQGTPTMAGVFNYTVTATGSACANPTANGSITVNPTPTLTGASQAATVCQGFPASINLTGLLAGSTSTVAYSINAVAQTPATGVVADGLGAASFTTPPLTLANNSQTLTVTGITVTSATPNCSASFSQSLTLAVNNCPPVTEFYVNDNSTSGDGYTGSIGNDGNPGTSALPFATINHAISVAPAGATIFVDAGTYNESVVVNKALTIKGKQAAVLAKGRSGAESVLDPNSLTANGFKIVTDNVTIDGFTITNSAAYPSGNPIPERSGVVTIEKAGAGNFTGIVVKNNVITRQFKAVNFNYTDNFEISGNWLHGEGDPYNYGCMWVSSYGTPSSTGLITNNDLDGYSSAVEVQGNAAKPVSNLTVSENRSTGSQYVLFGLQNSTVTRNSVLNVTTGSHVYIGGGCTNSTFSQNFFDGGTSNGLRVENLYGAGLNANLTIFNNSITGHNAAGKYEINVDAAGYTGTLTATCNWFGTTDNTAIAAKINGPVTYTPYLTSGADSDPSTAGFQPMPGSCNSNQTEFYVDDNSNSGDVYTTTATGSDVTGNGTQSAPYATIAKAISVAPAGATIYVDAGTYAENVNVNKGLTILGSNATINPNTGTRVGEAIIVPATNNVASGRIFDVNADNVTIKGFTINGDNTSIGGGYAANGADNNAAIGIACGDDSSPDGFNALLVENNIIKNLGNATNFNAAFYGSGSQSGSRTGSNVQNNKIDNSVLWGVVTENNFYTNVQNNVITRTGRGIQFDNTWISGVATTIAGNNIKYYRRGILVNLRYGTASPVTVSGNTIQTETSGNQEDGSAGAAAINRGLLIWSIAAGAGNVTLTDNNISNAWYGEELWNNASGRVSQAGGVLTNNQYGIYLPTNQDAYGDAGSGSNASVTRVTISNSIADGVWLNDNSGTSNAINLSLTNAFITGGVNNVRITGNDAAATINNNSLTGSSAKAINASAFTNATPVNATCNWYGTTNGTLVSSKVSGNVTYVPYLTNGSDSDPSTAGFQPTAGSCNGPAVLTELYVDDNSDAGDVYTPGVTGSDVTGDGSQTAPFATIAKALSVAANGNTIYVDAGTYGETITVNKQVVIKGAQAGVLAKGRSGAETVLDPASSAANGFKVVTDNVTIDGFTITNSAAYPSGERSGVITIEKGGAGNFTGILVKNNIITRQFKAVNFNSTDNFEISGNWLHGEADAYNYGCMWIASYGTSSANGVVFNNDLDGYSSAVEVQGNAAQPVSNLTVSGNRSTGSQYVFFGLQNSTVTRNSALNVTTGSHVYIGGGCTNSTFSQNFFDGGTSNGIRIENAYGAGVNSGLTVTNNSITGHTAAGKYEINVDATGYSGTLSATCNWFGSANNAVVSSKVSGPVTYMPYLTSGTDSDPSTSGFQPVANSCNSAVQFYVNDNSQSGDTYTGSIGNDANPGTQALPFATINHAVSVAPASATIYVDAGTYQEQVIVNKTLDIIGAGRSGANITKILSPATVPSQPTANGTTRAIVLATGVSNIINISKVLIDGNGVGGAGFTGVHYDEASGTFENSRITAIRDATFSGVQSGDAFVANHEYDVSKLQTVTVNNNLIDDYQKSGIVINELNTHGIVTNNTVTGQAIKNVNGQNGIQFAFGAYGTITGNTVSNNLYNDPTNVYVASGILLAGVGVDNHNASTGHTTTISNNTLTNNDAGLYSDEGGYGYNSNAGVSESSNTYNSNYTHISINAPASVPSASNTYDKRVDNTAQTNVVYGQIQRAVNYASADHTLNASAHTFTEQVEIPKNLTLNGAGSGTVIKSPATLPLSFMSSAANKPVVYAHDAATVILNNFTVDGAGQGNANIRFVGIGYYNAGGTVQNTEVKGIRNNPIDGVQSGTGIVAFANNGTARTLNVTNNNINDFQKNGTTFSGANLTVNVNGNTITGAGAVAFIAQNGVQISGGATGTITNNTISGFAYTGTAPASSTGVLVFGAGGSVTTSGNTVNDAQVGVYYANASGTVTTNSINYNAANMGGTDWYGVDVENGTVAVTKNSINGGGNGTGIEADYDTDETTNLTATNNFINNTNEAVVVYAYTPGSGTATVTANENSILGYATAAVHNYGTTGINATCNWYGTADNSLIAPKITGPVTYVPYLVSGTDNDATTAGFQAVPGSCSGPAALSASITSQTNVSCNGGNNGSVTVTASGGTPGYQYSIDGGANYGASGTFNGLAANSYTVTVKDGAGVTTTVPVTITQPTVLTVSATQVNNACYGGSNGSITATATGGTSGSGYQYSLSGAMNVAFSSNNTFANLPAGTYTVTVKDAAGCTASVSKTITAPTATTPDGTLTVPVLPDNYLAGPGSSITFVFEVREQNGNAITNALLRITNQSGYAFSLPNITTVTTQEGDSYPIDNSHWTATNAGPFYNISLNSGQQVGCGQAKYVAVTITRTTLSRSVFTLTSTLRDVNNELNSQKANNSSTLLFVAQ